MGETLLHKLPYHQVSKASPWLARLIQAGAWVNVSDNGGKTPLMLAERHNAGKLINLLVEAGAKCCKNRPVPDSQIPISMTP